MQSFGPKYNWSDSDTPSLTKQEIQELNEQRIMHGEKRQRQEMSKQLQHTPGPWRVLAGTIIEAKDGHVAKVPAASGKKFYEDRANARLIAAAPDLLEACEILLTYVMPDTDGDHYPLKPHDLQLLKSAIAKARGENK